MAEKDKNLTQIIEENPFLQMPEVSQFFEAKLKEADRPKAKPLNYQQPISYLVEAPKPIIKAETVHYVEGEYYTTPRSTYLIAGGLTLLCILSFIYLKDNRKQGAEYNRAVESAKPNH